MVYGVGRYEDGLVKVWKEAVVAQASYYCPGGTGENHRTSVNTVGVPVEVPTEQIPNTHLDPYLCTDLCCEAGNVTPNHVLFLKIMHIRYTYM